MRRSTSYLASGRYLVSQIYEIDTDDILGRSSAPADADLLREMVAGRVILVLGTEARSGPNCAAHNKMEPAQIGAVLNQ